MTWRTFWYAWVHDYLRRVRARRETESFQQWLVALQLNPRGAQQAWNSTQSSHHSADAQLLLDLATELPRSARMLLGLGNLGERLDARTYAFSRYERMVQALPKDSRRRAFAEAGMDVMRGRRRATQEPT
jgi:hypothetical protein